MINIQKRFVKTVAGTLSAIMITYAVVPAAAFAAQRRPVPPNRAPYHYRDPRHRHDDYTWKKSDTAKLAGLAAIIGLLALVHKKHRDKMPSYSPSTTTSESATSGETYYGQDQEAVSYAAQVLQLVNTERAKVGVRPLRLNSELLTASGVRAEEISRHFSHERPDGSSCFSVLPNRNRAMGENIAAGSATPEAVVDQWMNSPGHRANMLDRRYTELGVGHYFKEGSEYGHYWVQMFRG